MPAGAFALLGVRALAASFAKKERNATANASVDISKNEVIRTLTQVQVYFKSQSYPLIEAQKFYKYF